MKMKRLAVVLVALNLVQTVMPYAPVASSAENNVTAQKADVMPEGVAHAPVMDVKNQRELELRKIQLAFFDKGNALRERDLVLLPKDQMAQEPVLANKIEIAGSPLREEEIPQDGEGFNKVGNRLPLQIIRRPEVLEDGTHVEYDAYGRVSRLVSADGLTFTSFIYSDRTFKGITTLGPLVQIQVLVNHPAVLRGVAMMPQSVTIYDLRTMMATQETWFGGHNIRSFRILYLSFKLATNEQVSFLSGGESLWKVSLPIKGGQVLHWIGAVTDEPTVVQQRDRQGRITSERTYRDGRLASRRAWNYPVGKDYYIITDYAADDTVQGVTWVFRNVGAIGDVSVVLNARVSLDENELRLIAQSALASNSNRVQVTGGWATGIAHNGQVASLTVVRLIYSENPQQPVTLEMIHTMNGGLIEMTFRGVMTISLENGRILTIRVGNTTYAFDWNFEQGVLLGIDAIENGITVRRWVAISKTHSPNDGLAPIILGFRGRLVYERLSDGTIKEYDEADGRLVKIAYPNGSILSIDWASNEATFHEVLSNQGASSPFHLTRWIIDPNGSEASEPIPGTDLRGIRVFEQLVDGTQKVYDPVSGALRKITRGNTEEYYEGNKGAEKLARKLLGTDSTAITTEIYIYRMGALAMVQIYQGAFRPGQIPPATLLTAEIFFNGISGAERKERRYDYDMNTHVIASTTWFNVYGPTGELHESITFAGQVANGMEASARRLHRDLYVGVKDAEVVDLQYRYNVLGDMVKTTEWFQRDANGLLFESIVFRGLVNPGQQSQAIRVSRTLHETVSGRTRPARVFEYGFDGSRVTHTTVAHYARFFGEGLTHSVTYRGEVLGSPNAADERFTTHYSYFSGAPSFIRLPGRTEDFSVTVTSTGSFMVTIDDETYELSMVNGLAILLRIDKVIFPAI